jgi:hypothetical protein
MVEDQANPPKSPLEGQPPRRAADAMVLSQEEQMQHEKMREEVVRNFAKQIDRLELAEKLAKATGDLGKNLGKAGDKLMNVWDLNDLKDDTLEMQEHVGEDIKEDLDKHVRGAHEAVDKAKDAMGKAMRAATPHLLENLSLRVYRDSTRSDLPEGTVRQISILERVTRSLSPVRTAPTNGSAAAGRSGRDSPVWSSPGVVLSPGSSTERWQPLCRPESMLISGTRNGPSSPLTPPPPQPSANHDDTYEEKEKFSYVPSNVHTQSHKESVDDFAGPALEGGERL